MFGRFPGGFRGRWRGWRRGVGRARLGRGGCGVLFSCFPCLVWDWEMGYVKGGLRDIVKGADVLIL